MFKVLKLKPIMVGVALVLISVFLGVGIVAVSSDNVPKSQYTIVIDAGHGGRDDGCTGVSGTKESEINLSIARMLKDNLETLGINVVMTRCDGNGLYKSNVTNFKKSDMSERIKIIEKALADMVISIHQNSYLDSRQRGAQVFYQENDNDSRAFADSVQSQLILQLPNARKECNKGDYYLLKESHVPAVLIECGYLSNEEEEKLLASIDYQQKVSYAIMCGVVKYFGLCGDDEINFT